MKLLKAREVCELTGIVPATLTKWIRDGIVSPRGGGVPGRLRYFTITQVLGLHYARLWSLIGGERQLLRYVVDFFESQSQAKLEREFDAGRVFIITDPIGRLKLVATLDQDVQLTHWIINAKSQYELLQGKIEKLIRD